MKKIISGLVVVLGLANTVSAHAWETLFWCDQDNGKNKVVFEKEVLETGSYPATFTHYHIVFRDPEVVGQLAASGAQINSKGEVIFDSLEAGLNAAGRTFHTYSYGKDWTFGYGTRNSNDLFVYRSDEASNMLVARVSGCNGALRD